MRLDFDYFTPQNRESAFHIQTHESIHHLQKLGYSRIEGVINKKFKMKPEEFCTMTLDRLSEVADEGILLDDHFSGMLTYGVAEWNEDKRELNPRDHYVELESVLGESYTFGYEYFMWNTEALFGKEKAEELYLYMRDEIFGGQEYEQSPVAQVVIDTSVQEENEDIDFTSEVFIDGTEFFNKMIIRSMTKQARERADVPVIDLETKEGEQFVREKRFSVSEYQEMDENMRLTAAYTNLESGMGAYSTLSTVIIKNPEGEVEKEYLEIYLNQDGTLQYPNPAPIAKLTTREQKNLLHQTFNLNLDQIQWQSGEFELEGEFVEGQWIDNAGRQHAVTAWDSGKLSYLISYP